MQELKQVDAIQEQRKKHDAELARVRYHQIKNKTWVFVKDRPHKWTREYSNHYHQEYTGKTRLKILTLLGNKCVLCGFCEENKHTVHFHEIYGKIHKYNHGAYILKHSEDFVPLCSKCHSFIHIFCRSNGNIEKLVNLINWIKREENKEWGGGELGKKW